MSRISMKPPAPSTTGTSESGVLLVEACSRLDAPVVTRLLLSCAADPRHARAVVFPAFNKEESAACGPLTAALFAAASCDASRLGGIVSSLLACGANADETRLTRGPTLAKSETALYLAADLGDAGAECVESLIAAGADPRACVSSDSVCEDHAVEHSEQALHAAARAASARAVRALLAAGADREADAVDAEYDSEGGASQTAESALWTACNARAGEAAARELVLAGADVNKGRRVDGAVAESPLKAALRQGSAAAGLVSLLLACGASLAPRERWDTGAVVAYEDVGWGEALRTVLAKELRERLDKLSEAETKACIRDFVSHRIKALAESADPSHVTP